MSFPRMDYNTSWAFRTFEKEVYFLQVQDGSYQDLKEELRWGGKLLQLAMK